MGWAQRLRQREREGRMPQLQLVITLDEAGQVSVQGPIEQKIVCYGLLEVARDAIAEHHARLAQRLVQPASGPLPPVFPPKGSS
jgi:hypothetical protein